MDAAIAEVKRIVNQPVTHYPRDRSASVLPFWFHQAGTKPDFNHVDVRTTQDLGYSKYHYITSELNPDEMFFGPELEFNPMPKYFYTDYTFPRKRLSEAQMLEVNRLYRIIGRCEEQLQYMHNPQRYAPSYLVALIVAMLAGGLVMLLSKLYQQRANLSQLQRRKPNQR